MRDLSVADHLTGQLGRLCDVLEMNPAVPVDLLVGALGDHAERLLSKPPIWPSDVADDHSPVEFSIAYNDHEPPALRILAEVLSRVPGVRANMSAAYDFLEDQAPRFGLSMSRLHAVRDLFTTDEPQGLYALWCSLVFRSRRQPEFKVYLNPEIEGPERAPELVEEAFRRLRLGTSYDSMLEHAVRPGELGGLDRLTFFALDLHDEPQARVKLYLSHYDADPRDVARAAAVVDGVDPAEVAEFCRLAGGAGRFDGRPLVGSYTFTGNADVPVGYSIYVPIRSYVGDDLEARERVLPLLDRYRFDVATFDRAIAAVTRRPLADGVGLIAHVSLRLGPPRPGLTVYLSAEAYDVCPPRSLQAPAA